MSDLREGVTEAGHAVLDALDQHQPSWRRYLTADLQLIWAGNLAVNASAGQFSLAETRDMVIDAAARLIDAIGEFDRRIAAGEA